MYSLKDRIVFITGASSGIGASCAKAFAAAGAKLILVARTLEALKALASELCQTYGTPYHLLSLDVRDRSAVENACQSLPGEWQNVEILINNAGLSRGLDKLHQGSIEDWEEMIDTNVKGLLYMTRALLPAMVSRGCGHIINIGSLAGHQTYPGGNVYCATKAAVRVLSEGMKQDLLGTQVRVSSIDPGLVETNFSNVRFHGDTERAKNVYRGTTPLTPLDVADVVLFCASRPPHVNINEILMMPTHQSGSTLVHRNS